MKSIKEKAKEYDRVVECISPNKSLVDISGREYFEVGANYVLETIEDIVSNPRRYVSADTTVPEGMINDIVECINQLKNIQ